MNSKIKLLITIALFVVPCLMFSQSQAVKGLGGPASCSVGIHMPVFTSISPDTTSPTFTVIDQIFIESSGWYYDTIPTVSGSDDSVRYYIYAGDQTEPKNMTTDPTGAPGSYDGFIAGYTGIEEQRDRPTMFSFNVSTLARSSGWFRISVPNACVLSLRIYDVAGRQVATPLSGQHASGYHDVFFTPRSKGVYFYQFESQYPNVVQRGKLVIL